MTKYHILKNSPNYAMTIHGQFVYCPGKCKNTTAITKGKRKKSIDLDIFLSIMYYFYYDIGAITVSTNKCQN